VSPTLRGAAPVVLDPGLGPKTSQSQPVIRIWPMPGGPRRMSSNLPSTSCALRIARPNPADTVWAPLGSLRVLRSSRNRGSVLRLDPSPHVHGPYRRKYPAEEE